MTTETTTRFTGFCAACARQIKVRDYQGELTLVHHGFLRPGDGQIHGDCYGVHRPPHELSPAVAQELLDQTKAALDQSKTHEIALHSVTQLMVRRWLRREVQYHTITLDPKAPWGFESERKRQIGNERDKQRMLSAEIARLDGLLLDWTAKPLLVTDELKAAAREAREVKKADAFAKREERYWSAVGKLQARIDRSVGTRNSASLADIWDTSYFGLRDKGNGRTMGQVMMDVDRQHVWEAFGLHEEPLRSLSRRNSPWTQLALRLMHDRQGRIKGCWKRYHASTDLRHLLVTWPAVLGGEDKRGLRTLEDLRAWMAAR